VQINKKKLFSLEVIICVVVLLCSSCWLTVMLTRGYFFNQQFNQLKDLTTTEVIKIIYEGQAIENKDRIADIMGAIQTLEPDSPAEGSRYSSSSMLLIITNNRQYEYEVRISEKDNYALVQIASNRGQSSLIFGYASSTQLKQQLERSFR
jgi:hypothetical protein